MNDLRKISPSLTDAGHRSLLARLKLICKYAIADLEIQEARAENHLDDMREKVAALHNFLESHARAIVVFLVDHAADIASPRMLATIRARHLRPATERGYKRLLVPIFTISSRRRVFPAPYDPHVLPRARGRRDRSFTPQRIPARRLHSIPFIRPATPDARISKGARMTDVPLPPVPQRSPLRFILDHNPFYLMSAISMLLGCFALLHALQPHPGQIAKLILLLGMLHVYEFLLLGLAVFLIGRLGMRRDGHILLIIQSVFLADATFLTAEIFTANLTAGAFAAAIVCGCLP